MYLIKDSIQISITAQSRKVRKEIQILIKIIESSPSGGLSVLNSCLFLLSELCAFARNCFLWVYSIVKEGMGLSFDELTAEG